MAWHRLRPALRASARPTLRTAPVDHHHSCSDSPSHPAHQHTQALRVTTEPFSGRWRRGTYRGPQSALVGAGPGRRKRGHAPEGDRRFLGTALRAGSSVLRAPVRRHPDPRLVRPDRPSPHQPRRGQQRQQCPLHHRSGLHAVRPTNPGLRRQTHHRGHVSQGHHACLKRFVIREIYRHHRSTSTLDSAGSAGTKIDL